MQVTPAILKHNLDAYKNDAGGAAVTDWVNMRADCRRYLWAVYNAAMMFKDR